MLENKDFFFKPIETPDSNFLRIPIILSRAEVKKYERNRNDKEINVLENVLSSYEAKLLKTSIETEKIVQNVLKKYDNKRSKSPRKINTSPRKSEDLIPTAPNSLSSKPSPRLFSPSRKCVQKIFDNPSSSHMNKLVKETNKIDNKIENKIENKIVESKLLSDIIIIKKNDKLIVYTLKETKIYLYSDWILSPISINSMNKDFSNIMNDEVNNLFVAIREV
jgi:hypothetical protein